MYCIYCSPTTQKPPPRPQNAFSWGGTRRAAFRAPQGMCANTLFYRRSTRRPYLRTRARRTRPMPLKRPSESAGAAPMTDPHASIRSLAQSQPIWRVEVAPAAQRPWSVRHRPSKTPPGRDLRVYASVCMCMYHHFITCMFMYLSVSAECIC